MGCCKCGGPTGFSKSSGRAFWEPFELLRRNEADSEIAVARQLALVIRSYSRLASRCLWCIKWLTRRV